MPSSTFVLAAVGDALILHPMSPHMTDPSSAALVDRLQRADVAIANFEVSAFDRAVADPIPQSESGGLWLNGAPEAVADIRALGFTMVSRANNHATDFGTPGMEETDRLLDRHGIAHAGTGAHLGDARAPAYHTVGGGRVALLSATCTFTRLSMAAYTRTDMRGRPGVNYIRSRRVKVVDALTFNSLLAALHVARERGADLGRVTTSASGTMTGPGAMTEPSKMTGTDTLTGPDTIKGLGAEIEKGEACAERYILDERDVEANLAQVQIARRRADYVVFALHSHLPHNYSDIVPDAIRDLAHRVVDAGADVVLCHGAHRFKAVEVYRERPICYDLGNFICHAPKACRQPTDAYEAAGLDGTASAIDDLFAEGGKWATEVGQPNWWQSAIVVVTFEDGRPRTVDLHPVDLCQEATGSRLGTPKLGDAAFSAEFLARVVALSQPFGAPIEVRHGIGTIACGVPAATPDPPATPAPRGRRQRTGAVATATTARTAASAAATTATPATSATTATTAMTATTAVTATAAARA